MDFLDSYVYFIAVCFLASLLVFKPGTPVYLKLFPPFLLLTLVVEVYGSWLYSIGKNNNPVYNFFSTVEFCFYLFVLSLIIKGSKTKKTIRVVILVYIVVAVINILFIQKIKTFHTTTYAVGCLLVAISAIIYFLELFRHPESGKLLLNPAFWICTALLFFYCCGFPLFALVNQWKGISLLVLYNFTKILTFLNIALYLLFTIAFLCTRIQKYISLPL